MILRSSSLILLCIAITNCKQTNNTSVPTLYTELIGETMGTYYKIKCNCADTDGLQSRIESKLAEINGEVSTYISDSYISKVNQATAGATFTNMPEHFALNLKKAKQYYDISGGYFDVSTQPLVNYWGFGYTPKHAISSEDQAAVQQIKKYVGLDKWDITDQKLEKRYSEQQVGFAALAKGYAVDEVGHVLASMGCTDYYVDIGGEQVMRGKSARGDGWIVGISTPTYDAQHDDTEVIIQLTDKALASSGNYRNYHEANGRKYGHTIDPMTGYPYQDSLLAVSIIADDCIDADAIATACMAMGYAKATTFIDQIQNVSACFLVGDNTGRIATNYKNEFIRYVIDTK